MNLPNYLIKIGDEAAEKCADELGEYDTLGLTGKSNHNHRYAGFCRGFNHAAEILLKQMTVMESALEFYAYKYPYDDSTLAKTDLDYMAKAREALSQIKKLRGEGGGE